MPAASHTKLMSREVKKPRQRSSFLLHSVLRRIPGYLFFFVHLCFIHILWGQLVDELFTASLTFRAGNVSKRETMANAFLSVSDVFRRSVDQTLVYGLKDALRTKSGRAKSSTVTIVRDCLLYLWKSPSSMVFAFGLVFVTSNLLLVIVRIVGALFASLTSPCRSRNYLQRGGSRRPIPLHIVARYGNGYDSVLRFVLAAVELTWFMNYPVLNSTTVLKNTMDKSSQAAWKTEPTYASLRQLQARQQAIASFQIEASLLLPPQLFDDAADAVAAGRLVLMFVKAVLGLVLAVDAQRLFHAFVGVRPLAIPNGWERCPVCGSLWKKSGIANDEAHLCPIFFSTEPLTASSSSDSGAEETTTATTGPGLRPGLEQGQEATAAVKMRRAVGKPGVGVRPGDGFPDPNYVSFWSLVTDSWISPLMNFTLLAPFSTFSPPSISSITDDGRGHWQHLLRIVSRLPRMPFALRTRENIDEPAWDLWQRRREPPRPGEVSRLETTLMAVTAPIRRILGRAFAIFFLPAPPAVEEATKTAAGVDGIATPPARKGSALFRVFLRHPCGREYVYVCVPLKITQDLLSLVAPRVVKSLVSFLKEVSVANVSTRQSYLCSGLLICLSLILVVALQALFFQTYLMHLYASSLKATSALKTLLLHQSLETPLAYTGSLRGKNVKPVQSPLSPSVRSISSPSYDLKKRRSSPVASTDQTAAAEATAAAASQSSTLSREGEVMSLLAVDTTNCGDCLIFLHNVWGHPFLIVSSLMSMYSYVGLFSTLATFAALIALIPLNRSSAARVRTAQQQARNNESRLSDLTAALSSMRTVKSMALEECLMERLEEEREKESDGMKRVGRAESVAAAQTEVTTLLVALVCCGSYLLTGGAMDASVLVPTMAALQVMRFPVWTLPHLYAQVSRGYMSMQRIERYLTEHETGESAKETYIAHRRALEGEGDTARKAVKAPATKAPSPVKIGEVRCERCSFAWNAQKALAEQTLVLDSWSRLPGMAADGAEFPQADENALSFSSASSSYCSSLQSTSRTVVLHNIDLVVAPGEFVVIQGTTGSGKSAMLLAMLRELYVMPNETLLSSFPSASSPSLSPPTGTLSFSAGFRIGGRVAYCAEVPWLRQGSVRENIRLLPDDAPESAKERKWYRRVLEACALDQDLNALAKGDRTMVGENGSKLSGGQRARVALARAAYRYRETDVFIFDDVLSALDVEVQKHIISKLFHGLLSGAGASSMSLGTKPRRTKTIIFATHVPVSLLLPDRVLYLWADGTLHEDGNYKAPTAEQIAQKKDAWRNATVAAAEAKDTRRSKQETAGEIIESPSSPRSTDNTVRAASTGVHEIPPSPEPAQKARSGIGVLLPRASDLHRLFIEYLGGSRLLLFFVLSVAMQVFRTLMDNWLGVYISLYDKRNAAYESILRSTKSQRARKFMLDALSLIVLRGDKSPAIPAAPTPAVPIFVVFGYPVMWQNPFVFDTVVMQFLGTYAVIGLSAAFLSMVRTDYFFRSYQRMADALQLHAVRKLFKAPVSYFDRVPSSRLLQVLSRDQEVVDRSLGDSVQLIFLTVLQLLGMVLFNTMHFSAFIAVLPISALLFYHLTVRFLSFTKQVRALEGVLQSRTLGVVRDAVKGAITVRAFGDVFQRQLLSEMNEALDAVHVAANAGLTADRWVALRLEFVALAFTSALALLSVLTVCLSATASAGSAAFAGLGIISSMTASRSLSMLCRRFGMFQNQFVSAEQLMRLEEEIPQEIRPDGCSSSSSDNESSNSNKDEANAGKETVTAVSGDFPLLDVRHMCAKYQPQLPWVLTDICFALRPGECVGLIGRTGNGKSSIFNALLGLMDVVDGEILVPQGLVNSLPHSMACQQQSSQLNILHMPQHTLRKHYFELVSQEPLLLQGTCRSNLLLGYENDEESKEGAEETSDTESAAAATAAKSTEARLREVLRKVSLDELFAPSLVAAPAAEAGGEEATMAKQTPSDAVPSQVDYAAEALIDPATRTLDSVVTAGGANLSAGQRQLLCFARAILHHPRVVLLDEVSSRVDRRTDELIQKVIKEEILNRRENAPAPTPAEKAGTSGVLLIAHRLETILALCDRVLVIEQGRCVANLSKDEVRSLDDLESYL